MELSGSHEDMDWILDAVVRSDGLIAMRVRVDNDASLSPWLSPADMRRLAEILQDAADRSEEK